MKESQYIWMDGEFVAWKDAKVHVLTHTLHYGNGVFEGTRAYQTHKGLAIFRLACHTKRLLNSSKIVAIDCPFSQEQLENAQIELLRKNHFDGNVYLRPIIFLGYGAMGVYHKNSPVNVAIAAWEWGAYLGDEGLQKGIRVKTSSFVRNPVKSFFGKAKVIGVYTATKKNKLWSENINNIDNPDAKPADVGIHNLLECFITLCCPKNFLWRYLPAQSLFCLSFQCRSRRIRL